MTDYNWVSQIELSNKYYWYRKNTGNEEEKPKEGIKWMSESKSFFAKKPEKESFFAQEPEKKDGWFTKDDFK